MTFSQSILRKITTSATKKPDSPQVIIDNPFDADIFINGIELILSPEFSKKGKLYIEINDITEFDGNDSKQFDGYAKYPIPLSKVFRAGHDIKIYAWNGTDTNEISISLNTSISKEPQPFNSQAVPMSISDLNAAVSDFEEIFPQKNYSNEPVTQLISMEGHKKLILQISGFDNNLPTEVTNGLGFTNKNYLDGDLSTQTNNKYLVSSSNYEQVVDYGSIASRIPAVKFVVSTAGGVMEKWKYELFVSDDNIDYGSALDTQTINTIGTRTLSDVSQSFRYMKLVVTFVSTNTWQQVLALIEMYDGLVLGGTASISFETLGTDWIELISATELLVASLAFLLH